MKAYFYAIFFIVLLVSGCSSNRDDVFEKKLISELLKHKTDDINFINLKTIFGDNWESICIASPYATAEVYESLIGKKLSGFEGTADNEYAFLVFFKDGSQKYIFFDGNKVMFVRRDQLENTKSSLCTSINKPFLYFNKNDSGIKEFFIQ